MKLLKLILLICLFTPLFSCTPEDAEDEFPKHPPEEEEESPPSRTSGETSGGTTGTYDDEDDYSDYDGGTFGGSTSGSTGYSGGGTSGGTSGGSTGGRSGCDSTFEFDKGLFASWSNSNCMTLDLSRGSFSSESFDVSITSHHLGTCNCQAVASGSDHQGELEISSCVHEDLDTDCTGLNGSTSFENANGKLQLDCQNSYAACGTYY